MELIRKSDSTQPPRRFPKAPNNFSGLNPDFHPTKSRPYRRLFIIKGQILRGGFFACGSVERLVVATAVDRWHLRSHRTQVGCQLAPVMDAVIVQEAQVQHCRKIEQIEKVDGRDQLLRRHRRDASHAALYVRVVPRNYLG